MTMGFQIDTGFAERRPIDAVPDWFRDMHPADAPDEKVLRSYAYHIIGEMKEPKTMATVRKHFLAKWSFIRDVADLEPALFDEILAAYAEQWLARE